MELDSIEDDFMKKVQERAFIDKIEAKQTDVPLVDSGLSSIEKSQAVKPDIVALMSTPLLIAPTYMESVAFAVASVDASGKPNTDIVRSIVLKGEEIKDDLLQAWMQNLREIQEYVRQLLASPLYLQLQEISQKNSLSVGGVSEVQNSTSHRGAQRQGVELLSTLDRLQVMERVPPSAEVVQPSVPQDSSQALVLPLAAALLAGGVMVGTELLQSSTHSVGKIVECLEYLNPIFPQLNIQDLIPVINLMIVGPIYYHSWNEAVHHIKNRKSRLPIETVQNFAKDMIKIVDDPNFIQQTFLSRMKGTDQLSSLEQDRLASLLKIILIGVALSLMYSIEVGKVQDGQFGGIEAEELRDLFLGNLTLLSHPKENLNFHQELTQSLIKRAQEQFASLSIEDRTIAAEMLLDYLTKTRDLNPMLDPARIFDEMSSASTFNFKEQIHLVRV